MACTCCSSDTSTPMAIAVPPADSISRTVSLALSTLMSATMTRAPSPANLTADTRPTPEPAPVTIALLPSRLPLMRAPASLLACPATGLGIRHDGRFGRSEPVQPFGIAAEQLVLHALRQVLHRIAGDINAVRPRRVRVRLVRL